MNNYDQCGFSSGDDSSYYLAMSYDEFDIQLKDINEERLEGIGIDQEVKNLSAAMLSKHAFPVQGILHIDIIGPLCQEGGPNFSFERQDFGGFCWPRKSRRRTVLLVRDPGSVASHRVPRIDALRQLKISLDINWDDDTFKLIRK